MMLWPDTDSEKKAAYAQGWRDAIEAIMKSATCLRENSPAPPPPLAHKHPRDYTAQWYLLEVLQLHGGMSHGSLFKAALDKGCRSSVASLRVALHRLHEKKMITSNEGKWFLL